MYVESTESSTVSYVYPKNIVVMVNFCVWLASNLIYIFIHQVMVGLESKKMTVLLHTTCIFYCHLWYRFIGLYCITIVNYRIIWIMLQLLRQII